MRGIAIRCGVVTALAALAGCGQTAATTGSAAATPRPTPTAVANVVGAREAVSPDPNADLGFTIQVTETGFRPRILLAPCCGAVVWKNLTSHPVRVVFDHQLVDSGPIPAGGSFSFTPPNIESITYHEASDAEMAGMVQINPTRE